MLSRDLVGRKTILLASFICLSIIGAPQITFAGECYVDDESEASPADPATITIKSSGGTYSELCGHTIHGSGCTVEIEEDQTFADANTDCVRIGKGVTLDFNGNDLTCTLTSSRCGYAILPNLATGSGALKVKDGVIDGCWQFGIGEVTSSGTGQTIEDITIDLDNDAPTVGCGTAGIGIVGWKNIKRVNLSDIEYGICGAITTIEDAEISDMSVAGVQACGENPTIKNAIIRDSDVGVLSADEQLTLDNVLLIDNNVNIDVDSSSDKATLKKIVAYEGADCHCTHDDTCQNSIDDCGTFSGSFVSFVDDAMR